MELDLDHTCCWCKSTLMSAASTEKINRQTDMPCCFRRNVPRCKWQMTGTGNANVRPACWVSGLAKGFKGEPLTVAGIDQVGTNDRKSILSTCSHQRHCLEPNQEIMDRRKLNTPVCYRTVEASRQINHSRFHRYWASDSSSPPRPCHSIVCPQKHPGVFEKHRRQGHLLQRYRWHWPKWHRSTNTISHLPAKWLLWASGFGYGRWSIMSHGTRCHWGTIWPSSGPLSLVY